MLVPLIICYAYEDWITCFCIIYGMMFDVTWYIDKKYYLNPDVIDNETTLVFTLSGVCKIITYLVCCVVEICKMFAFCYVIGYTDEYFLVYLFASYLTFGVLYVICDQINKIDRVFNQYYVLMFRIVCLCIDTYGLYIFDILSNGHFLVLMLCVWLCVEIVNKFQYGRIYASENSVMMKNFTVKTGIIYLLNLIYLS